MGSARDNARAMSQPKNKTKKKQATFEFAATDARARELRVHARRRTVHSCSSPNTVKVRRASTHSRSGDGQPATSDPRRRQLEGQEEEAAIAPDCIDTARVMSQKK